MKKVGQLIKILGVGTYLVGGIMLAVFLLPQSGIKALSVATGSMTPAIPQGSLVIIRRLPPKQLKAGDVVTYINPANTKQTITHRIVATKVISGLPGFVTKGDANQAPDKEILGGNVVGKVVWHLPVLGNLVSGVRNPVGLSLIVLIPAGLIIWDEIRRLRRALRVTPVTESLVVAPINRDTAMLTSTTEMVVAKPKPAAVVPIANSRHSQRKGRRMDSMGGKVLLLLMALPVVAIGSTRASLSAKATLTGNTISASIAAPTPAKCPSNTNITIANTGPGSTNNASVSNNCQTTVTNTNNVTITNTTNQTATSGSISSIGNSSTSQADSGSAANGSSSETTIQTSNY